jgi:hypothetical protein
MEAVILSETLVRTCKISQRYNQNANVDIMTTIRRVYSSKKNEIWKYIFWKFDYLITYKLEWHFVET